MQAVALADEVNWDGFRTAARRLVLLGVSPEEVVWSVGPPDDLFAGTQAPEEAPVPVGGFTVARGLIELAQEVIQARDGERFALLYRLIWRAHTGERHLLGQPTDPDVHRARALAQSVRRDTHKMRAFVRFRAVAEADRGTRYVAWFEPSHFIVQANAPFFVRRFATMTWSILTPDRCAHWDGTELSFAAGAGPADVPDDDALALVWRTYYESVFNPGRLKVASMSGHMPRKYWKNLPEAAAIPGMIRAAEGRTAVMLGTPVTASPRPADAPAPAGHVARRPLVRAALGAAACRRCSLCGYATATAFGEGPADAPLTLVGEQPGDQEDLAGRPFVGPAG